ncbi:MAG: ABC transporter ATP-binding protein [Treponema sp.]|jgi:energy-coupling factor transport system ATP-binding protein|nr:ABC transporter ATP-binding protein [Treponema sp.]
MTMPDKARQAEVPAIAFSDFSFTYRSQTEPTLHNITLTVRQGEKILIAGPSGSGKSTLAHCINGLIPYAFKGAASGSFGLMGKTIFGASESSVSIFDISKIVGTVLQDTDGQFVALTAAEDIAFVSENDCVPLAEMKQRVLEAAKLVRIEEQLAKAPHDLSGGQKQRVSLAGVLTNNVDILLFDEPLANLDPATGTYAIELIDRIHRETNKTIIIVEHRIEDALHCPLDRIIIIEKGRISADLPPDALLGSRLLTKAGLREPLYLSALRYAGASITREQQPEHISRLRLNPGDAGRLRAWADQETALARTAHQQRGALLEAKDISFHYPEDPRRQMVLNAVSFSIKQGERVSLVGKNGAGKSTLAKLITGFYEATAGSLSFEAHDMASLSIKERAERIGYVMQNPNQMISFPWVFDETALAPRSRGMPEAEVKERAYEALRVCGLYPFRNWPVSALSFGQKKRLTIASILVMGVSLLILDEPTAGQDFRHYSEIMAFLRRLNQEQGLALLMITHDMHLMLEHTTRAIVIAEGRLLADASPAAVLTNDELIGRANLKRTSLYDLALKADIKNPQTFVQRFIDYEETRANDKQGGCV